jgi:Flp pilus assembly protein TadD
VAVPQATDEAGWRRIAEEWKPRYERNTSDPQAAIIYARALRALDKRSQAVAVLQQAALRNATHMQLLGAYGRALADTGQFEQALEVLGRAHTPDRPDWRVLNVTGAVLDQLGRHAEAQNHYATALRIAPEEPAILSNLGLSQMLSRDLSGAETTLRRALARPGADARVRQNLALVLALRGRFDEAERMARADLPPELAAANVALLREMVARRGAPPPAAPRG